MNKAEIDWSVSQRQGGSALLIIILKTIIDLVKNIWPFAIAILLTGKSNRSEKLEWFLILFSFIVLVRSLLEFYFFRFQIIKDELVIHKGVFTKKIIVLPLEKIIAVHIDQTWLHQLLSSAKVSFDSAGSIKTEVVIDAIPLTKAESLRQFITESKPLPGIEESKTKVQPYVQPIISLSANDILKLCISANHIEGLFILIAFGLSVVYNISEATGKETTGLLSWVYERIDTNTVSGILFLGFALLLVSITVSIILVLLRYSNFRIVRSEKGFSIRSGLINTKEKLVPFRKIQYLSWKANWLREKMGIFLLHFHAAGTLEIKERMEVKVPVTQKRFITEILKDYHDLLPVKELKPLRVDKAYITRNILLRGILPSVVFFIFFWFNISWTASWFFLLIPYAAFTGWLFWKKFRLWAIPEALQIKKGIFGIEKSILIWNKIQSVQYSQSIFQRRKKLATLKLFTAGGVVNIPYIMHEEAMKIYNNALFKIESENKPWM